MSGPGRDLDSEQISYQRAGICYDMMYGDGSHKLTFNSISLQSNKNVCVGLSECFFCITFCTRHLFTAEQRKLNRIHASMD